MGALADQDRQTAGHGQNQPSSEDANLQLERQWANSGEAISCINVNDKVIEEKERELITCIAQNYTKLKDVEKELAGVQLQLRLTSGPKKSALELLRRKIEAQNEHVLTARRSFQAARKVAEAAEEALKAQEAAKDRLCQELNLLVQQSANAQLQRLEELTQKIEVLNRGFLSTSQSSGAAAVQPSPGTAAVPASPSQAPKAQPQAEFPKQAAHPSPAKAGAGQTQGEKVNQPPKAPQADSASKVPPILDSPTDVKVPDTAAESPQAQPGESMQPRRTPSRTRPANRPPGAATRTPPRGGSSSMQGKRALRGTLEDLPHTKGPFTGFD